MGVVAAIDTGYGDVKFAWKLDDKNTPEVHSFPSLAPMLAGTFGEAGHFIENAKAVGISVNGKTYAIGEECMYHAGAAFYPTRDPSYSTTDEYLALTIGAMWHMKLPVIDRLVVGLPVNVYKHHPDKVESLRKRLVGQHVVPGFDSSDANKPATIHVRSVDVLPQVFGALIFHAALNPQRRLMETVTCVIDPGQFTLDVLVRGKKIFFARSDAFDGGMASAYLVMDRALGEYFKKEFGNSKFSYKSKLHLYSEALRRDPMFIESPHGDTSLDPFLGSLLGGTEMMLAPALSLIGDTTDIMNLVVTGGGARWVQQVLLSKNAFQCPILCNTANPAGDNVSGFLLYGLDREKRLQQEAA